MLYRFRNVMRSEKRDVIGVSFYLILVIIFLYQQIWSFAGLCTLAGAYKGYRVYKWFKTKEDTPDEMDDFNYNFYETNRDDK